jgi:hypothetical protein
MMLVNIGSAAIGPVAEVSSAIFVLIGLFFYRRQAEAATREHLNNVHQSIFNRLDAPEIRAARHYVYAMDTVINPKGELADRSPQETTNLTYQIENWLTLGSPAFMPKDGQEPQDWKQNKAKAETVARALDQLGYLVREGIVPLNVVARFYSYPALKCWYKLCPYIGEIRRTRDQWGHMWEFENLVGKIIKGSIGGKGVWEGTREHDNLMEYADKIEKRTRAIGLLIDEKWNPPDRSWVN